MPDLLSIADQDLLRDAGAKYYGEKRLYPFGETIVWKGRVNEASPTRGQLTIVYDGGALQAPFASVVGDIQPGMLIEFGTVEEGNDLGSKRLLQFGAEASGSLVVDWHDNMQLVDNAYITLRLHHLPAPKFSHFTVADGVHKDGPPVSLGGAGEAYSDQNRYPPPHPIIGLPLVIDQQELPESWWLTPSIDPAGDVVAAYQGIGAATQALARQNVAKFDGQDLVETGTVSWSQAGGWDLSAAGNRLETPFNLEYDYTVLVCLQSFSTSSGDQKAAFGIRDSLGAEEFYASIRATNLGGAFQVRHEFQHGGVFSSPSSNYLDPLPTNWTVALGKGIYGVLDSTALTMNTFTFTPDRTGTTGRALWIGDINDTLPASTSEWTLQVRAIAVYSRPLSAQEMTAIGNQMQALASPANGQPNAYALNASRSKAIAPGADLSSGSAAQSWSVSPASLGTIVDPTAQVTQFVPSSYGKGMLRYSQDDSNGKTSVTYRPIIVENPASPLHIREYTPSDIPHSTDQYNIGRSFTFTSPDTSTPGKGANPDTDWSIIGRLTLFIETQRDTWSGVLQKVTVRDDAVYDDRRHIRYVGYVTDERREFDDEGKGRITLQCRQAPLALYGYAQTLTGVRAAEVDKWYKMSGDLMTTEGLSFHYLYYHSTLIQVMDVILPSDPTKRGAMEEWVAGDLMGRFATGVNEKHRLLTVTITPQGELIVEPRINMEDQAGRDAVGTVMTLEPGHLVDSGKAEIRYLPSVSQVWADGFQSPDGVLGNGIPLRSVSDNVRLPYGTGTQTYRGLIPADQTELNRWTGRFRDVLSDGVEITLNFSEAMWDVLYVAPQRWFMLGGALAASLQSNLRGASDLENVRMVPVQVVSREGRIEATFEVERPDGLPGRTVPIPTITPDYATQNALPAGIVSPPVPSQIFVTGDKTNGMELHLPDGNWETRNGTLTGNQNAINSLHRVPLWWLPQQSADANDSLWWRATDGGLFYSNTGGLSWANRTPTVTGLPSAATQSDVRWQSVVTFQDANRVGQVVWAAAWVLESAVYYSYLFQSSDFGAGWTQIALPTGDRVFNIAAQPEDETQIWLAFWESATGTLRVGRRDNTGATVGTDESFGAATMAEVDAETYYIRVETKIDTAVSNYGIRPFVRGLLSRTV